MQSYCGRKIISVSVFRFRAAWLSALGFSKGFSLALRVLIRPSTWICHRRCRWSFPVLCQSRSTSCRIFLWGFLTYPPPLRSSCPGGWASWSCGWQTCSSFRASGWAGHLRATWRIFPSWGCSFLPFRQRWATSRIHWMLTYQRGTYFIGGDVLANGIAERLLLV